MIVEIVEMKTDRTKSREQQCKDAYHVVPKWQAIPALRRKHFLLGLERGSGAGLYFWDSIEAAKEAHNAAWIQAVIERTGEAPTFRYFDMFMLLNNEDGTVTEIPPSPDLPQD